jgi:hypothetical protein
MAGGFAISGRGPVWGRTLAGLWFTAALVVWLVTAVAVGGGSFALDTAHGLWVSLLFESLLVTFAVAASAPHRSTEHPPACRDPQPSAATNRARCATTHTRTVTK